MTAATTVAVNLLWCVPGQVGGSEEYLARQLVGLTEQDHGLDITLYALPGYADAHPDLAAAFRIVESAIGGSSRPRRIIAEHTWLARRTKSSDLVHHGGGTVPAVGGRPVVLTIHDLQYRELPHYFSDLKLRYLRRQVPRSVARAGVIAVPSEYVGRTVVDAFHRDEDDVVVVRHGLEPSLGVDATSEDELRSRYGLGATTRVLVFPAITHPHKRHDFLVELLARYWTDDDIRLVLLGGRGSADVALVALIDERHVGDRVIRPGRVSPQDRDGFLKMATALVFPSEYEGFGAPVLEAMALGTPVIASDRTAVPEVVGDAGLLLPLELDAWSGALLEVDLRRDDLVAAGMKRAARFTAANSAGDLLGAYPSRAPMTTPVTVPTTTRPLRLSVLCPHFAPDVAPTGEVMTRIVLELAERGHELHVVTALPWYQHHRIEPGWGGTLARTERTAWGSITRIHPFPGPDKRSIPRRALGFAGFSALAALTGMRGPRVDGVLAMSPPLTLGLTGWLIHLKRRGPLVFNIQDVFPDAARATGAITNGHVLRLAEWLERVSYRRSSVVTVLSDDLRDNVATKLPASGRDRVRVIPNFVDTDAIRPLDRMTGYRAELGIGAEPVVMYAGNVGFSQSLDLLLVAARALPEVTFLINGGGAARLELIDAAKSLPNVRFGQYQPKERLAEVLATGDIHVVPLRAGLAHASVPSKTYSILAAGRPVLAAIDPGTEVPRILERSGAGLAVAPDDPGAFVAGLRSLLGETALLATMGAAGRSWVEGWASPAAVALSYERLFRELSIG